MEPTRVVATGTLFFVCATTSAGNSSGRLPGAWDFRQAQNQGSRAGLLSIAIAKAPNRRRRHLLMTPTRYTRSGLRNSCLRKTRDGLWLPVSQPLQCRRRKSASVDSPGPSSGPSSQMRRRYTHASGEVSTGFSSAEQPFCFEFVSIRGQTNPKSRVDLYRSPLYSLRSFSLVQRSRSAWGWGQIPLRASRMLPVWVNPG